MLEEQTNEPVAEVEEQPKPEVTVEQLQEQLSVIQRERETFETNWKNEQRVKSKKDQEIQRLREQLTSNESQSSINKALIAMMASQKSQSSDEFEAEVKTKQPDLMKQYEQIVTEATKKQELARATSQIRAIQERTEALGIKGDDYDVIRAFATAGEYDKAEARLDRLENTKPPEPKESDDVRIERLANERAKAILLEKGVLNQDTGAPSASATSTGRAYDQYARGEITIEEAKRKGCVFN